MFKKLVIFLLISFAFSWSIALGIYLSGIYKTYFYYPIISLLLVGYMFGPAVGAIVAQKASGKTIKELGLNFNFNVWWVVGTLVIVGISLLTVVISFLMGAGINSNWNELKNTLINLYKSTPDSNTTDITISQAISQIDEIGRSINYNVFIFYLVSILFGVIAGITVNAVAGFGEELGWRGFLFEELKNLGFVRSSLIIGFIWGVWHSPIIAMGHNFPQHPTEGIFLMILFCILLSFVMNYFRQKSRSVILSSIMHGTLNGTAGLYLYANTLKNDILFNTTGISGMVAIVCTAVVLFLLDRKTFLENPTT